MSTVEQSKFEGYAVVELMGHQRDAGFVTTEYYGSACLFRIDSPELPERDFELKRPEYIEHFLAPIGSKVRRPSFPAKTRLVAPGAIYALNPCTKEAVELAIDNMSHRPLILLSVPERNQ